MVGGVLKRILQLEGLALFSASLVLFHETDISWWMYAALFFVPDVAFIAFLAGPRIGSIAYNMLHSTIGPLALAGFAWWFDGHGILGGILIGTAVIWIGHVGFDRMLGYGLKYASGFKDTHLGKL